MKKIRRVILDFIEREYKLPENIDYNTFNLMENGYIDSMRFVQFVAILEDEFDIEFTSEEILSDKIKTIAGLESIINEKLKNGVCE